MTSRFPALRIFVPLYAVFAFMNLYPPMPETTTADTIQILLIAATQTACAGGLVWMITSDPGKPEDEAGHA